MNESAEQKAPPVFLLVLGLGPGLSPLCPPMSRVPVLSCISAHLIHSWSVHPSRVTPVKCAQRCLKGSRTSWGSLESQGPRGNRVILHQPE